MTQSVHDPKIEFQDKPVTPILTLTLILCMLLVYWMAQSTHPISSWCNIHCFNSITAYKMIQQARWSDLATMAFFTTFGSFAILQMALNFYFFWVFGKHVEQKLGPLLYMLLLACGMTVPIGIMYWETYMKSEVTYVGPFWILCTIIGAYAVFPPIPKSKIGKGNIRAKNEIFRRDQRADPLDKYIANPWMFLVTFGVFQFLFHFWATIGFWLFDKQTNVDTMSLFPALGGAACGFVIAKMLVNTATRSLKDGPMTLQCLKCYHELVDLDVGHEEAIKGTARQLGLPYDKVKEWVQKNKGNLRVK
jgi:membrane associated rhomboid family serine protease